MAVTGLDVGLVSASHALVDFYLSVFDAEELEARHVPTGVVNRLQFGSGVLKIMVPTNHPDTTTVTDNFWDMTGIRYVGVAVDRVDEVVARCTQHGGQVVMTPTEIRPGVQVALLRDPEGNTLEVMQSPVPTEQPQPRATS